MSVPPDSALFAASYAPERSRLTTFFRALLVIPHAIALFVYGIAAYVAVVIAWFAILFTGRYPSGLYDFVAGLHRWAARVGGYLYLLTDEYPPFDGDEHAEYPVRLVLGPPKEQYSRLLTFFRAILYIPVAIIGYFLGALAGLVCVASWFVILVTGRQPQGLQDAIAFGLGYTSRGGVYASLLTEAFPPFSNGPSEAVGTTPAGLAG
ncbi:DUF4389 domain-containing protein [Patulibacter defluvii]|uniref:DUF4389 domain-containing protein n=1 Tax=Patulibacter defluvii TaxID=3095358 RepID=UPI002A7589CA|nr:DUF4389 domain-containing protein [Patulibacter sp. DM4]